METVIFFVPPLTQKKENIPITFESRNLKFNVAK